MNRFLSQKFRFYSFVCIALLLFVHGYNLKNGYLQSFSLVDEPLTFTTFIEFFLANGLLRFRIPLLFIISGYIFALQDHKPYFATVKKRFITLMIPFLIWSAVGLLITWLWQQHPVTAKAVADSQMDQLNDYRPYSEIGWGGVLYRWLVRPVSFQLWFVRSLFLYNIAYPLFKWAVVKYPLIFFSLAFVFWVTFFNIFFFEGQGLLFFTFGVWLQKTNYPIDRKPVWFSHYLSWVCFVGFAVIKTFMAFELESTLLTTWVLVILYAATVIAGLLAVWFGADPVVKWCMQQKWFMWATAFSFVIYGMHVPLIEYVTLLMYHYMGQLPNHRLIVYILAPALVLFVCMLTGAALRQIAPKIYRVATGGRGF